MHCCFCKCFSFCSRAYLHNCSFSNRSIPLLDVSSSTEISLAEIRTARSHLYIHSISIQNLQPTSDYLVVKVTHTDFQMKMEDMHLSGPDNTKLEVRLQFAACLPGCVRRVDCLCVQALVHDIYSELVEDACLGLCFEVHRAVKQGYFFLDEMDQESMKEFGRSRKLFTSLLLLGLIFSNLLPEIVDQPGVDIFGQVYNQWKNKECECPNCKRLIAASRFAPHLEKCLGMGRNSSRIANRRWVGGRRSRRRRRRRRVSEPGFFLPSRLATNNLSKSESDQEDNDDLNDNDWSYGAEKKGQFLTLCPGRESVSCRLKTCFPLLQPRRGSPIRYPPSFLSCRKAD